jgi:hypothetical protein
VAASFVADWLQDAHTNLLNSRTALSNQTVIGIAVFVVGLWIAWQLGAKIVANDFGPLEFGALAIAGLVVAIYILKDWRTGFYMFLVWLLFEDLVRKYLGNNMAIYFAKDILVGLVYISFFSEALRRKEKLFSPPFMPLLLAFVWLGVMQVFNQNSPSVLYGILGFKLYFYYIPLVFVGYGLIRTDVDLQKFLIVNLYLGGIISTIAIMQAILGHSFLNPTNLAPELRDLGQLDRYSPITNQVLSLPTAVFVSSGRLGLYLVSTTILTTGTAGYLLLSSGKYRRLVFSVIALVGGASLFSGSRTAVAYGIISVAILVAGFLWGAPWRWRQAHRLIKAIRSAFVFGAMGLGLIFLLFPDEVAPRMAFYTETLNPNSSASELGNRSWDYPIKNLEGAFEGQNWVLGNGIGTASLGGQYVARLLKTPELNIWVEEGYGVLIVEMGIIAPFLWLLWTGALVYTSWVVVKGLRQTRFFPIAFAILWYAFLLLYPFTYGGISAYENFVCNMYLWILVGILFKLPTLQKNTPSYFELPSYRRQARGGLQF